MKTLIFFAPLVAATLPATAAPSEPHAFTQALAPGQMHEECMHLDAGEKRDAMRGDGGTFTAKTAEDYCWMWTAREKAAKLEGRIETSKP